MTEDGRTRAAPGGWPDLPLPLVAGAATTGAAHTQGGQPCQDRFAYRVAGPGAVVVAVADGLGSAAQAARGAAVAVEAAVQAAALLVATVAPAQLAAVARTGATAARSRLEMVADAEELSLGDLACTIIVVAAAGGAVGVAHVGDGAVVVQTHDGLTLASGPGAGEYVDQVDPITGEGWQDDCRAASIPGGVTAFAALTDGCQRAALQPGPDHTPHPRFLLPIFDHVRRIGDAAAAAADLSELLAGAKLSEHSDDDKTLVVAILGRPAEPVA